VSPLARAIAAELAAQPSHFGDLVQAHMDVPWRDFLRAWGEVRAADVLSRDDAGRYLVSASPSPSAP
jgi:hypothetical protein